MTNRGCVGLDTAFRYFLDPAAARRRRVPWSGAANGADPLSRDASPSSQSLRLAHPLQSAWGAEHGRILGVIARNQIDEHLGEWNRYLI
jgi:hypothetical protein